MTRNRRGCDAVAAAARNFHCALRPRCRGASQAARWLPALTVAALAGLAAFAGASAQGTAAQGTAAQGTAAQGAGRDSTAAPARRVLVVTADGGDPRIEVVREAIDFWRDTFAKLELEPPLVEAGVVVAPPGQRAVENFAWQISRAAGRLPEGVSGPPPPPELDALDGDVVVLLSAQPLMPFARPLPPDSARYLVAIPAARDPEQPAAVVARNIVAHELGHTLGLRHGEDPTALMCEPCSTARADGDPDFRPLTAADRARLVELYRRRPPTASPPPS